VVQLEVEEDRQPDLRDLVDAVVAVRAEEFEAQLQAADMRGNLARERFGRVEARHIESQIDGIMVHFRPWAWRKAIPLQAESRSRAEAAARRTRPSRCSRGWKCGG